MWADPDRQPGSITEKNLKASHREIQACCMRVSKRERHTPQLTVWWTESWLCCLFIWMSSSSLRKQTCPGLSDSTQWEDWPVVQPLRPSLALSISRHICSQAARWHNIHKQFSFLCSPMTDGPILHIMDRDLLRACSELWLTSSLFFFVFLSYAIPLTQTCSGSQSPTFGHIATLWVPKGTPAKTKSAMSSLR